MANIRQTELFSNWFDALKDAKVRAAITARIRRASLGNFGDTSPIGEGVSEMRIHLGAGWRVYFMRRGEEWVLLLAGGNKRTQQKDIQKAIEIAKDITWQTMT